MKKNLLLLLILLSLMACGGSTDEVIKDDSKVLAVVGEYQITEAYLVAYLRSNGLSQANDQQKSQGLNALINQISLAHQADKEGLKMTQQQIFEIDQAKQRALAQVAIEAHLQAHPISDVDIQAEYQRITAELKGEEYHVRHLLFEDETDALVVLDQINAGASYVAAEAQYLSANPQVKNVGDIGWVNIMQVPEVFRRPLRSMPIESVHPQTLVSEYGVHILFLENKRPLVAPALATVEAGIRKTLKQKKVDRYQQLAVIKSKAKLVK